MVGNQIGEFRVIEKLGEGGMGVVYKAIDTRLDRHVAIKMLTASLTDNPELVQRFQAEARAQANLNHTNLATLYAFLVDQGNAYMVMEFIEGENFDQIIRRNGPMHPRDAVPWFKQALLGIGAAHRVGIIHRDIKPSNLMLNRQGIVKVMDFGIAKAVGSRGMTRTGMHLGTLAYMSPEQIQNRTVDIRSDIYALGITLYEMLSGHVPFESESDFQMMHDHVSTLPPALARYYPYAPKEFEGVVAKALAKNPDDRFQTVEEFGAALEHPEKVSAAPLAQLAGPLPANIARTVIDSSAGSRVSPGAPPSPRTVRADTGGQPPGFADSAAASGRGQSGKRSPRTMMMGGAGVVAVVLIALTVAFWPDQKPKANQSSALPQSAGPASSMGVGNSSGSDRAPTEIVIAEGGSDTPAPLTSAPPAAPTGKAAQPAATHPVSNYSRPHQAYQSPQRSPGMAQPQQQTTNPQAGAQSFIVKHAHVVKNGADAQTYYCAGVLLLRADGSLSYNCAGTNDPSKRCDQATFPPGSIHQLTLKGDELHLGTASGNWDFYDYNVPGSINNAYRAILPFVQ